MDYEIDVLTPEEPTRMYDSASLPPHGAISIYQEAHWISQGWPGSGIESDPYRIENLYIDTSSISEDAILVANTATTGTT